MIQYKLRPSIEMWNYCRGNLTVDHVLTHVADRIGGFYISYTATEILKDLCFLDAEEKPNKLAREFLARELHERFYRKKGCYVVVDPTIKELNKQESEG